MARDNLVWTGFRKLGRFGTPTRAIFATGGLMALMIVAFDIEGIAKLASAFQLLLFSLLAFAVIVMRESRIEGYDPGYRSPLYPWMQIVGMVAPLWLISEMGGLAILFTLGLVAIGVGWYFYFAAGQVEREGAILHTFARLGQSRYSGLDLELRGIVKEKGLRAEDPFDQVVARAEVIDLPAAATFSEVVREASTLLSARTGISARTIQDGFLRERDVDMLPIAGAAALPHLRLAIEQPELVIVRARQGVPMHDLSALDADERRSATVVALFFLASPKSNPGQHLRLLGHLATHVDDDAFLDQWLGAGDDDELRATLLREERSITIHIAPGTQAERWIDNAVKDIELHPDLLIALVRRGDRTFVPRGSTVLRAGDRLTLIGDPEGIESLTAGLQASKTG